jgi:hypothetical protein
VDGGYQAQVRQGRKAWIGGAVTTGEVKVAGIATDSRRSVVMPSGIPPARLAYSHESIIVLDT